MMKIFRRFMKNESGATAIEYGLIAALLSVAIITALGSVKEQLNTTYNKVSEALSNANQ